jgi:hypothetical protein
MPSLPNVLLCALSPLVLSLCIGVPLARWFVPERPLALALAPSLGWAVFAALALPALDGVGFTRVTVTLVCGGAILAGLIALRSSGMRQAAAVVGGEGIPIWTYGMAALVAIVPALGVWPKRSGGGIVLAETMFDHSKVAIIDDIVRLGLPPGNPFFGAAGAAPRLAYYYLWHFSAAVSSSLLGSSGWEADIGLTWFTAFASLTLMMGFAVRLGGHRHAALWVVLLSCSASLRPVLPAAFLSGILSQAAAPHSWMFQVSWAPQHLASACCVVLAVYIMLRLAAARRWPLVPLLAVIVAAGFESSTWVGGIVFAAAAVAMGLWLLIAATDSRDRQRLMMQAGAAGLLAIALVFPFLRDEYAATLARHAGFPLAFAPFPVLGPTVPASIRWVLDLPAYWLVLLVIEFPAIYPAGTAALVGILAGRARAETDRRLVVGLALLAGVGFGIAWLFASTIANNDLGWRAALPGVLVLTSFAASGLARWRASGATLATLLALACLALGLPDGVEIFQANATGTLRASAALLAETPALWADVRRHAAPDERVANNPLFLADSVGWPINISWALLANRRSCYAGWNLARPFVALPGPEIDRIDVLFLRVFAGDGAPEDVRDLATRYDCRVVVVAASDGAWRRDPFAASRYYRLVEEKAQWRIYRVVEATRAPS